MTTALRCIAHLFLYAAPLLTLWAVCCHAISLHLSGGPVSDTILVPPKPEVPAWRRDIQRMHRRLKVRASLEWARIQAERQARRGRRG